MSASSAQHTALNGHGGASNLLKNEVMDFYRRTRISEGLIELRNITIVAELIIRSALARHESRGLHFTTDYPARDDARWLKDTYIV